MLKHVEPDAARDILLSLPASSRLETVPLDRALDRVLAENIYAGFPVPPFDKSPFDGFAFRAEDVPGTLKIEGEIAAGGAPETVLAPGTAIRIFTGAPLPEGADATVKAEDTAYSDTQVRIERAFSHDENVIKKGEDFEAGTLLALAGTRLCPSHLGVLASQGVACVRVFCRPRAAIISTGSELAMVGEERPRYGIYNSSLYSIKAYLIRMGFDVVYSATVEDDAEKIRALVSAQMEAQTDLVFTTGGASVGDYDFAVRTTETIGADVLFWKVNMKPGGALLAAMKENKALLSLSGNPAAALMSLLTVVQPYLRKLCGEGENARAPERLRLPLEYDLPKISSGWRMLRGRIHIKDGRASFAESSGRGNGNIASFESCDAIALIPGASGSLKTGTMVDIIRLPYDLC